MEVAFMEELNGCTVDCHLIPFFKHASNEHFIIAVRFQIVGLLNSVHNFFVFKVRLG